MIRQLRMLGVGGLRRRPPSGPITVQELDSRGEPCSHPSRFVDGAWRAALAHARYLRRRGAWVRVSAQNCSRTSTWGPLPSLFGVRDPLTGYLHWRKMRWVADKREAACVHTWRAARALAREHGGQAVAL